MSKGALKGAGGGCLGCGCLLLFAGLVCFILVAAGAVNSAEEGTAVAAGLNNLCCGLSAALVGGILLFLGFRDTPDE
jgi:hypothetical protein